MTAFDPALSLSRRTAAVEEAAIIRMAQKARDLEAAGHDVVSLTIGEPDFDTPAHIRAAATRAMEAGFTHYGPVAGFPELRAAISKKLKEENGIDCPPAGIVMANGAKQAITNACFAVLDPGDEVIMLAPFWAAYEGIVRMAGGVPVVLHAGLDEGFKVPASRIAAAVGERTKLVMINTPCNPSGAMFDRAELAAIAAAIAAHPHALVLADEIYEYIAFDAAPSSIAALAGMAARTITVNGFSKGFAMTGWRLGWGATAAEPVARAMAKVQGAFTAGPNAFVQQAAIAALEGPRDEVARMRATYQRRRDVIVDLLAAMPGVRVHRPAGTFYVFPEVSALLGRTAGNHRIDTVENLCDWLLDEHKVATVPGTAFGDARSIRLSFATTEAEIRKGLARLAEAVAQLS
jgi:aspartate aminotransferase